MTYLLCHGFGFTHHYWDPMLPFLDDTYTFFDESFVPDPRQTYTGIGHSLGFLKLSLSDVPLNACIGLQGFINFCGIGTQRIQRRKNLERMIHAFSKNPQQSLRFFYNLCGFPGKISTTFTIETLIKDLKLMQQVFPLRPIPTLILGSRQDKVVPSEVLEDNFKPPVMLKFIEGVNHTLGFSKPQETFVAIKNFLKSLKWSPKKR